MTFALSWVHDDFVHADFCTALLTVQEHFGEECELVSVPCPSGAIDLARQSMTEYMQQDDAKHLTHGIFVDSDQVFSPEHIERLIDADKDIIGSLIVQPNGHPAVFDMNGERWVWTQEGFGKVPVQISGIGMGLTAIKREVFEAFSGEPAFRIAYEPAYTSEDRFFCIRAQEKGFTIWCHPDVRPAHLKMMVCRVEHFDTEES